MSVEKVIIGPCEIYLGDCLEILPTLEAGSVDLIVSDPPYGHNNNNNGDLIHRREAAFGRLPSGADPPVARPIANDGAEANDLFRDVLPEMRRILSPGCCCCCCCCGGGGPDPQFARWSLWMDEVFDFKQMIVWDKGPMGMGWHYRRSYETVLVGQVPGAACHWFDDTDAVENIIRPGYRGIRKIIPSKSDHPTPKPVPLAQHFIALHSTAGQLVCDPFMGRAWVGEACVFADRRFVGIEIDPEHFNHARKRLERAWQDKCSELPFEPEPQMVQRSLLTDTCGDHNPASGREGG